MFSSELYKLVFTFLFDMFSRDHDLSLCRFFKSCQHIQKRRLTGTGCTYDRTELSLLNGEIHTIQRLYLTVTNSVYLIEIFYTDNCFTCHLSLHFPKCRTVWCQLTATAKIMYIARY